MQLTSSISSLTTGRSSREPQWLVELFLFAPPERRLMSVPAPDRLESVAGGAIFNAGCFQNRHHTTKRRLLMYEIRQTGKPPVRHRNLVVAALIADQTADESGLRSEVFQRDGRNWRRIGSITPPRRPSNTHQLNIDVAGREADPADLVCAAESEEC
jgi:hypothetical protein